MADDSDRMRELRERIEQLKQETAPIPSAYPAGEQGSADLPNGSERLRAGLKLLGLILSLVVTFQVAFTLMSFNGNDFGDARRVGQATVESCQQHGPIGWSYGYWDECLVSIKWNDGVPQRSWIDKPNLFHADEVGKTAEIGDNGYGRSGQRYSRPDFEPQPLLAAVGVILFIVAAVPAFITVWVLWHLIRGLTAKALRRS